MPHEDLPKGEGRILTASHVALYRDPQGGLQAVTSVCTHMGCDVGWNDRDKLWECPCHGSRFAPSGEVVRGPAQRPLAAVDVPE